MHAEIGVMSVLHQQPEPQLHHDLHMVRFFFVCVCALIFIFILLCKGRVSLLVLRFLLSSHLERIKAANISICRRYLIVIY